MQQFQRKPAATVSAKKRGRPSGKGANAKEWTDSEIFQLIDQWESKEILYNTKHFLYYNKEERDKAVVEIKEALDQQDINATTDQIFDKMTNLKCYYGSQKRQTESIKSQPGVENRDYVSPWKFYNRLHFLKDHFMQRSSNPKRKHHDSINEVKPIRKIMRRDEQYSLYDPYAPKISIVDPYNTSKSMTNPYENPHHHVHQQIEVYQPPSQPPPNVKVVTVTSEDSFHNGSPSTDAVMTAYWSEAPTHLQTAQNGVVPITNGHSKHQQHQLQQQQDEPAQEQQKTKQNTRPNQTISQSVELKKSEDECFCELMLKMLSQVPETQEKALLKLEMQQKVIALRYKT